jgi:hypothetical protein
VCVCVCVFDELSSRQEAIDNMTRVREGGQSPFKMSHNIISLVALLSAFSVSVAFSLVILAFKSTVMCVAADTRFNASKCCSKRPQLHHCTA